MNQLTAVYEQPKTMAASQWWSVSVHTGDNVELTDAVLLQVIAPLAAQAELLGVERWYFDRRTDRRGLQVRAHFLGSSGVVERLQRFHGSVLEQVPGTVSRLDTEQRFSSAPEGTGDRGLASAEQVFEVSSELAVWASQRFTNMHNRSAMAALLLSDSARAMLRGPRSGQWPDQRRRRWDYYWDSHLKWRTADMGQNGSRIRATMAEQVSTKVPPMHCLMAATAADSTVHAWRRRWSASIDRYLHRTGRAQTGRSAYQLTLQQGQMMLNRLGFTVREEAILGFYARSWTAEKEHQLVEVSRS